jgi:TonB-linked SusC/RagA family outer membrane protein
MRLRFTILQAVFIAFMGLYGTSLYAQTYSILGKVSDEKGETLLGASVVIEGTSLGAITDLDGNYEIGGIKTTDVTLVVSFVGYTSQKRKVSLTGKSSTENFTLSEDSQKLNEVVVIGYGQVQKRDIVGSVSTLKSKDMANVPLPSFEQAFSGRAAGVVGTAASGVAGAPVKITIRGTNSISAGAQPLYVIDGIPIIAEDLGSNSLGARNNSLSDINMNDIETIDILKDAAATAIYGSRGANGVVIITTKKGKSGRTKFDVNYSRGWQTFTNNATYLTAEEHLALRDRAFSEIGVEGDQPNTVLGNNNGAPWTRANADSLAALGGTDWIDAVTRLGSLDNVGLSASGGTDKTTFYLSAGVRKDNGFLEGNTFQLYSSRANVELKASDRVKLGINFGINFTKNQQVPLSYAGGFGKAQQKLTYLPIYANDGETLSEPYDNPVWQINNREYVANIVRNIGNIYLDVELFKGLSFRSEWGGDLLNQRELERNNRNLLDPNSAPSTWDRRVNTWRWTNNDYFTYNHTFADIHNIVATAGFSYENSYTDYLGIYGGNFIKDNLTNTGQSDPETRTTYGSETGNKFVSTFARANYKFKDRYLLSASVRRDGSSRFAENNKYGIFPSIGLGWIVSDEPFFKKIKVLSYLKTRLTYGLAGNANIGDFASIGYYNASGAYNNGIALQPSTLSNPNLGWEKSEGMDFNIDFGLLKDRIVGSVTLYTKTARDLLLNVNTPTSSGYSFVTQNIGKLSNKGIEIQLTTRNISKRDFAWTTDFNISFNRNKVLDLSGLPPDSFEGGEAGEGRVLVGYPVGQAYVVRSAGVQNADGYYTQYDINGNAMLDAQGNNMQFFVPGGTELFYDRNGNIMTWLKPTGSFYDNRVAAGSPIPNFWGGMTNTFTYKGFDFSFLFSFQQGNTIYDDDAKSQIGNWRGQAQRAEILNAWTPENPNTDVPRLAGNQGYEDISKESYVSINSTRFLFDGSYIRLRNLAFGYTLPQNILEKIKMDKVRIYLAATNLLLFTKYPGWDPEVLRNVSPNSQQGNVSASGPYLPTPQAKSVAVGINLTF